jgi:hypothetical protein
MNWKSIKTAASQFMQGYQIPFLLRRGFVIDRRTWLRGESLCCSSLLRSDGKRCCLGFYCRYLGVPDEEMLGVTQPYGLSPRIKEKHLSSSFVFDDDRYVSVDNQALISLNDTPVGHHCYQEGVIMTEELREKTIAEIFARNNVPVRFVN